MIASDIHGSSYYCGWLLDRIEEHQPDRVVLLGDLLYHGPRNDLPKGYEPKDVIPMLNGIRDKLLCVRGNCDTEVDQMVLEFPVMADYCIIIEETRTIYATHGHIYNQDHLPPLQDGDVLLHGHTHVLKAERRTGYTLLNPGSVSLPKEGNIPTYAVLENGRFSIKGFDGTVVKEIQL